MHTSPSTLDSAPEGPKLLVVVGQVTEIQQRAEQVPLFPLQPTPKQQQGLPQPGEHLRFCPLQRNSSVETKKNMAQMKEQIKAPEKIKLSDEEIANISDAEFKPLVTRMLTEMVEYIHKI